MKKVAGYLFAAAILTGGLIAGTASASASVAGAEAGKASMVKTGDEALAVGAIVATGCSGS